jgi:8-oxo-dGTP pyrophosphatase MutT (NUDIX family)
VASKGERWRQRVARRLEGQRQVDDARAALLERVVGEPSAQLEAVLAVPSTPAAVLVGLIDRPLGPTILLTERAAHLPHHPGQISFPGGRLEPGEDPMQAALREAREEVGLDARLAEVLGRLPAQITGTGFVVTPIVAWLEASFAALPDPAEVETAFEVPIEHLLAAANHRRQHHERWGTRFISDEFYFETYRIWGATAAILRRFIEVIDAKSI